MREAGDRKVIRESIDACMHSFTRSLVRSFVRSFNHLFISPVIHLVDDSHSDPLASRPAKRLRSLSLGSRRLDGTWLFQWSISRRTRCASARRAASRMRSTARAHCNIRGGEGLKKEMRRKERRRGTKENE